MQKKRHRIHICMLHPQVHDAAELYKVLHFNHVDELPFEFIWDDKTPRFLIATDLIYTDSFMRKRFEELYSDHIVTIFMAGECIAPDLNLFDYAVCFDDYGENDRVISYALRDFYGEYITKKRNDLEGNYSMACEELSNKNGFCNFIYSNPNGHVNREKIFHTLNSYKKVDSFGAFLNNTGHCDSGSLSMLERVRSSVKLKSGYKFTIAFENATYRGYTSEKLFTSLEAHSIPIYWGNPEVGVVVNEKAIINCHNYDNFEQVLQRVKEIDQNDELWCRIVSEPWLTKDQERREEEKKENYDKFLSHIFLQDPDMLIRRGSGTMADQYKKFFFGNHAEYDKCSANFQLSMKWIRLHHQQKNLGDFFTGKEYKTVAVYGMGIIGMSVYEEILKYSNVERIYGIDRGSPAIPDHMQCMHLWEIDHDRKPDAVIVTVLWDMENIRKELEELFHCDVYSVSELVDEIMKEETGLL